MYAIWAYLLPCNHRKACRETKWTIHDRALHATSKQISLSIEAPLNSGISCMVRDGKWATTHGSTLFGQEVRSYFPPGLTLVFDTDCFLTFGAKTTRSTSQFFGTYWWLTSIQTYGCPSTTWRAKTGITSVPYTAQSCHRCSRTRFDRSTPTIPPSSNVSKLYHFKLRLWMSKHDIFPIPSYFVQPGAEECVFGSRRKLKVSVLSAYFKKCRFCNFSGSYTKCSPLE